MKGKKNKKNLQSPKGKKSSKEGGEMAPDTTPVGYLRKQGQFFPLIEESMLQDQNKYDNRPPFPVAQAKTTGIGDLVYVVYDQEQCYLGRIIAKCPAGGARVHFADVHQYAGYNDDGIFYEDFGKDENFYMVQENDKWEAVTKDVDPIKVKEYVARCPTITRKQNGVTNNDFRQQVLVAAIILSAAGGKATEQSIIDAYNKIVEETTEKPTGKAASLGTFAKNIDIIQKYFEQALEASVAGGDGGKAGARDGVEGGGKGGSGVSGDEVGAVNADALKQILEKLGSIEERLSKAESVKKVAQLVASPDMPDEVDIRSMPGDGKCLYWLLAAVDALMKGEKLNQLKFDTSRLQSVKEQIMINGMGYMEKMREEGKDQKEVALEWMNKVGEDADTFYGKVMGKERLGDKDRWGGHVEAMLYGWREEHTLVVVNADKIDGKRDINEARKLVTEPWPEDGVSAKKIAVAVLSSHHYYLFTMSGKGVFDIGDEYQKALDLCLKKIMSERSPAATFDEIAKIKDSKKRLKLVREKMSESNELKVTRHKKKEIDQQEDGAGSLERRRREKQKEGNRG